MRLISLDTDSDMSTWSSLRQQRLFQFGFLTLIFASSSLLGGRSQWLLKVTPLLPWLKLCITPFRVCSICKWHHVR